TLSSQSPAQNSDSMPAPGIVRRQGVRDSPQTPLKLSRTPASQDPRAPKIRIRTTPDRDLANDLAFRGCFKAARGKSPRRASRSAWVVLRPGSDECDHMLWWPSPDN